MGSTGVPWAQAGERWSLSVTRIVTTLREHNPSLRGQVASC
jgi:hypothetical protein